ncbi:MAG TPA: TetR/AcrR family transcriptional regulator [Flavobacteriales bacterium]|nr:TetR/AcrR family transcriptional regulator [Flavobacteriales bacterium]HPH82169.1 TetR/AcrR family transcriptional regulator [Flavobacteriales bacterium]
MSKSTKFAAMEKTDRKSEILHVAAKLFRERGYNAVSMRDIAKELDIKAASLYNHISSKQEILELTIIRIAEAFTNGINLINSQDISVKEQLTLLVELHIKLTLADPDAMACVNNDWMHLAKQELDYFIQMRNRYEDKFRSILKKGISSGEIADLNVELMLFSMLSTLRTLHLWYGRKKSLQPAQLKADMTRVLLQGIL